MKIDLKKYMNERDEAKETWRIPGPVVTISREYGCEANKMAVKLIHKIAGLQHQKFTECRWRYINKEIIEKAARELKLMPDRLEQRVINRADAGSIFSSFSHHYSVSDKTIIEKVKDVIMTYGTLGHTIVVGRGSHQIVKGIRDHISVRLVAPAIHRARIVGAKNNLAEREALKLVEQVDQKRRAWTEHLTGKPFSIADFDLVLNTMTLSENQIIDEIIYLMNERELLKVSRPVYI